MSDYTNYDFCFNNKNASELGLKAYRRPNLPIASKKMDLYELKASNGSVYVDTGFYNDITIALQVGFIDKENFLGKIVAIKNWLKNIKDNTLSFSDDLEYFYKVLDVQVLEIERKYKNFGFFEIGFVCKPFKFLKTEQEFRTITSGISIINKGEVGEPIFRVAGSGTVVVNFVNTQSEFIKELGVYKNTTTTDTVTLTSVSGTFYVDTESAKCYSFDGSNNVVNRNANMSGLFPKIKKGETAINWTGTVTKFEIATRMGVL